MKFLVIGLGSIGKRHIRNLIKLKIKPRSIYGFDPREDRRKEAEKLGINSFYKNLNKIKFREFDGAFICSPTSFHIDQAIILAKQKINLFIEKPLDSSLKNIAKLKLLEKKMKIKILITYPFRFSDHANTFKKLVIKKVVGKPIYFKGEFSEYLPDWHPYEKYNSFYMAKKKLGGGSILDQSHILDIAHYLFGNFSSIINCFNSKISNLKVKADDVADIVLKTKSGMHGTIHQDIFGRHHKKFMTVYCEKGNIDWNVYDCSVKVYNALSKKTKIYKHKIDHNNMYINQTKHIFKLIKSKIKPKVTLDDGIHTLKTILLAEKKSKTNKIIKIA
jgi:predicted dehydrogenase